jgi:hypothetical protein
MSSADLAPYFGQDLVAGDWLDLPRSNFVAAANRFRGPEALKLVRLAQFQAFDELIGKESARIGRQLHYFLRQLF